MSEKIILALNCLPGVFTLETCSIWKSGSSLSLTSSTDVSVSSVTCCTHLCPFCAFLSRAGYFCNRCIMILLRARETFLAIPFTFFFLVFVVVDPPHLLEFFLASFILPYLLCTVFFPRHLFVRFAWSVPTVLTCSSVGVWSCFMESSCLFAASFDLQILSVLSRFNSSFLNSRSIGALSRIPITILYLIISVIFAICRRTTAQPYHILKSLIFPLLRKKLPFFDWRNCRDFGRKTLHNSGPPETESSAKTHQIWNVFTQKNIVSHVTKLFSKQMTHI